MRNNSPNKVLLCNHPFELAYGTASYPEAGPDEAIIKIRRVGICGTDLHAFEGTQPFFSYPRILGHELAGEIVSVESSKFMAGDAVTIIPYFNCGVCVACRAQKPNCCTSIKVAGVHTDGGMQEFFKVPAYSLVHADGLGMDELALIEPLAIGAHAIRRAKVEDSEFVIVIGAGPIGLGTMEFARIAGANVIAIDVNDLRLEFCNHKLGVQYTINAMKENAIERVREITGGDFATVVIDATGNLKAINNGINYLAHGGRYVLVGLQKENFSFSHPEFHKRESTLMSSRNATRADFEHVIASMKKDLVDPATYITHRVSFDEVKDNFSDWLKPETGVIKAMASLD
jgi:2-desacetyl-2-hydroxyethyl bacteriochlorophyllide A dehydrogenase